MKFDWDICLEIGLNHMGSYSRLRDLILNNDFAKLGVAVTIQIREEIFYKKNSKFQLDLKDTNRFISLCKKMEIPCGIALGPLKDIDALKLAGIEPDFFKTISIASAENSFLQSLFAIYNCPKYISVGLSELDYITKQIVPFLSPKDMLVHTSLSYESKDQYLGEIKKLNESWPGVCYGLHARSHDIVFAAIGAGAEKVFLYIGDKKLDLPDYIHAIDLRQISYFVEASRRCFQATKNTRKISKSTKIQFID